MLANVIYSLDKWEDDDHHNDDMCKFGSNSSNELIPFVSTTSTRSESLVWFVSVTSRTVKKKENENQLAI